MEIRVGTFLKEINSTKAPDISSTTTPGFTNIEVQLKDNVSILSPVILISDDVYDPAWNYCYIYIWHRFYFLHDAIITTGGIWEVQLGVDVLATWKSYILNASAYVARSASNYSNFLPDPTWSHDSDIYYGTQQLTIPGLSNNGSFLLYVSTDDQSTNPNSVPALGVYELSPLELKNLCSYLFSQDFFNVAKGTMDTTTEALAQMVFNPFQYVVKCMWVPFTPEPRTESNTKVISFGWWEGKPTLTGGLINTHTWTTSFGFRLGNYNNWTDRDPAWTRNLLYVPGFGQLEISSQFQGQNLTCDIVCDLTTGEASLFIWSDRDGNNELIQTATGKLGADIQLTALYEDIIQDLGGNLAGTATRAISGAVVSASSGLKKVWQGIKDVFTGNGTLKDITSNVSEVASSAVQGAQAAIQPTCSTIGANGTRSIIEENYKAIYTYTKYNRYEDIHTRLGGVCNKILTLSGLSGYTEVVNPKIDAPCTSGEITMLNAFMSGGFYIE